ALNIATRNPELSGLNLEAMTLIAPNQSHRLVRTCVEQWVAANPKHYQYLLAGRQFDGEETERLRRQSVLRTEVLPDLTHTVIHEAKSSGLLLETLQSLAIGSNRPLEPDIDDYNLLQIAAGLYQRYQDLLKQQQLIDYDDMILAALRVLEQDSARQLWQAQVYAIFEDEAQDSSPLQTQLLQILAADSMAPDHPPNLVRVGDPNQAINSTFTPADPVFFHQFCEACQRQGRLATIDQAGRSTQVIMDAANFVLAWVNQSQSAGLEQPFRPQVIRPVAANDPQPDANPVPVGQGVEICVPDQVYQTVERIGQRVIQLMSQHPQGRAAVLIREHRQGRFIADLLNQPGHAGIKADLKQAGIDIYDVGQRDRQSHIPAEVLALLQFIDRPHSPDYLKAALRVLVGRKLIPTQDLNALASLPEQFLYPDPLTPAQSDAERQAQRYCCSLLRARLELPPYQLIPFLALTLNYEQSELATADKLAARIAQQTVGDSSLTAILSALSEIVGSERFEPVETEDTQTRYTRPRQLTIITMHKAKGLDWDFVFLPFLHQQTIPGRLRIPPQAQFLGDFTLSEVARAQIRAHIHALEMPLPSITTAWARAGHLKTAEEFRLLYVAMTRAKRLLWMSAARKAPFTWSKPENLQDSAPCPVIPALKGLLQRS
ncbi:MAG: ATP-dependent helicase, partial [Cyanothece sp. SIO1E1]|nr:ATP-dependent helicase [Cyanothece sp. SIO1E1]